MLFLLYLWLAYVHLLIIHQGRNQVQSVGNNLRPHRSSSIQRATDLPDRHVRSAPSGPFLFIINANHSQVWRTSLCIWELEWHVVGRWHRDSVIVWEGDMADIARPILPPFDCIPMRFRFEAPIDATDIGTCHEAGRHHYHCVRRAFFLAIRAALIVPSWFWDRAY